MPKVPSKKTAARTARAPAAKTAVTKKAAPKKAARKAAVKKTAVKKTVAAKTVAKKTTAVRKTVKKAARKRTAGAPESAETTTIIAKIDAGFGNQLYLRGNGAGLTWDKGTLMENAGSDEWIWTSGDVKRELEFKVVLNDSVWSMGGNGVVFPGSTVVFEPVF